MVSGSATRTTVGLWPSRDVLGVAGASGGAFASFYCLYSAASLVFAGSQPSAGVRVAVLMAVVVAVQPLMLVAGRWLRNRARVVGAALVAMAAGLAVLPAGDAWPGLVLLGAGFGVFVVTATAWTRELAAPGRVGQAMGIYGFGSAVGGALGAPVGLFLATQVGASGVIIGGAAFALLGLIPVMAVDRHTDQHTEQHTDQHTAVSAEPPDPPVEAPTVSQPAAASAGRLDGRLRTVLVASVSLAAHLMAVTLYATVLSSAGSLAEEATAMAAVLAAFAIQGSVAVGRLASGALCDRWSAGGTAALAAALLALAVLAFSTAASPVVVIVASAAVGATAGAIQTAALTLMMRRAHTPGQTEQVSVAWNIVFDLGLGLGALAASLAILT